MRLRIRGNGKVPYSTWRDLRAGENPWSGRREVGEVKVEVHYMREGLDPTRSSASEATTALNTRSPIFSCNVQEWWSDSETLLSMIPGLRCGTRHWRRGAFGYVGPRIWRRGSNS